MKWLLENARYLSIIGILSLLVGALTALVQGAYKLYKTIEVAIYEDPKGDSTLVALFGCLDNFLVATALIVISVSLYELFIGKLEVPDWMLVRNLEELKAKFSYVVIPVMAVKFVQKVLESENSLETFYYGAGIALVVASLTAFNYVSEKEREAEYERHPEEEETRAEDLKNKG
jgi:uncharacterized membrane protein YqhA